MIAIAIAIAILLFAVATPVASVPQPQPQPLDTPPEKIQQVYQAIIKPDNVDENTVLYGVPTSLATLNGDRMFVLNLSFVSSNVTEAKLHLYHKQLAQFRFGSARNVRMAVYALGRNGQLQRNAHYVSMANMTQAGWTETDVTDVINRLLKTRQARTGAPWALCVALQFELERNGKMHQVPPNKFMLRRNAPYVILSSAASDTSNFYNWFEAVLKSGAAGNPNVPDDLPLASPPPPANNSNSSLPTADQADSPFVNLFGLPPRNDAERVCSVRAWNVPVPRFLRKYVIHPTVLSLNRCAGACLPGVSPEDFRNSLIGRTYFDQARRTRLQKCCVPDKLGPLEMVFLSTKDAQFVVSRVSIPNLVAESCKCIYSYA